MKCAAKRAPEAPIPGSGTSGTAPLSEPSPIDLGVAGASARREFERRHAKREAAIEEKWGTGRVGRFVKSVSTDPQSTAAWAQGARGEERVAATLTEVLGDRGVVLNDRRVPRTRANIDHLAVTPSGVWVIDAKRHVGKVEKRDVGGWFSTDIRLYVGGRDRTTAVSGLDWQIEAVRNVLGDEPVPVHPALSFVDADWPVFFAKPFKLNDVWVSWPRKLAELALAEGPLTPHDVDRIARLLASRFPAK